MRKRKIRPKTKRKGRKRRRRTSKRRQALGWKELSCGFSTAGRETRRQAHRTRARARGFGARRLYCGTAFYRYFYFYFLSPFLPAYYHLRFYPSLPHAAPRFCALLRCSILFLRAAARYALHSLLCGLCGGLTKSKPWHAPSISCVSSSSCVINVHPFAASILNTMGSEAGQKAPGLLWWRPRAW